MMPKHSSTSSSSLRSVTSHQTTPTQHTSLVSEKGENVEATGRACPDMQKKWESKRERGENESFVCVCVALMIWGRGEGGLSSSSACFEHTHTWGGGGKLFWNRCFMHAVRRKMGGREREELFPHPSSEGEKNRAPDQAPVLWALVGLGIHSHGTLYTLLY